MAEEEKAKETSVQPEEERFTYIKESVENEKALEKADADYTGSNIQVLEGL